MERFILKKLLAWKNSPYRKPLILKGVRQVGKTWILKEFGRRCYENTAYFNFDENEEYKQFFETTKDVDRILQNLMLASGQKIVPEKTLIIFDEVQDCPKVINAMKYFCENAPQEDQEKDQESMDPYTKAKKTCDKKLNAEGANAALENIIRIQKDRLEDQEEVKKLWKDVEKLLKK